MAAICTLVIVEEDGGMKKALQRHNESLPFERRGGKKIKESQPEPTKIFGSYLLPILFSSLCMLLDQEAACGDNTTY